ncbi:MAG: hypothetical protein PUF41_11500 [Prevotella copri]|nr:hypothetical protein [Segatella copri]
MTEKYLGCGCIKDIDDVHTWHPIFTDGGTSSMVVDMCDKMDINLGSEVKPIIGTANDYALSTNKPSINGVTLIGDKSNEDLKMGSMTNMDIENILNSFI